MAHPQCSQQSRRGLLKEETDGFALAPQRVACRAIVGAVEPECKTVRQAGPTPQLYTRASRLKYKLG
jgi:hypothetical protein